MKKFNKKGFTLVELIVVSTIMVMVMGAILNFIRPLNRYYERTQAMDDTNDIGSILMNDIDNQLRYATNVVVLQDYQGVPQLSGGYLVNSSGESSFSAKLSDVFIIDNNHVRGSQLAGYDAQGTVAHRKGAQGCILQAKINDTGIDFDNMEILESENLYNDYGCTFDAALNTLENGGKCLTVGMQLMRPSREGLSYEFKKVSYNQTRDFELVNVNLDLNKPKDRPSRNMNASFYSGRADATKPIDYNNFVQSSNTGSSSSNHLEADGTYTYIFMTKEVPKAKQITIRLFDGKGSTKAIYSHSIQSGSSISDDIYNKWMQYGNSKQGINGSQITFFNGILSQNDEPIDYYRSAPITTDMDFYCDLSNSNLPSPAGCFEFYDKFNDSGEDLDYKTTPHTVDFYPEDETVGTTGIVNFNHAEETIGSKYGEYEFVGWYRGTNIVDLSSVPLPTGDANTDIINNWFVNNAKYTSADKYYAIYRKLPTVGFNVAAPDDVPDFDTSIFGDISIRNDYTDDNYKDDDRLKKIIQYAKEKAPEGKVFENLHIIDSSGEDIGVLGKVLTEDLHDQQYMIKPVYKDCAYEGTYEVTITIEDINPWYNSLAIQGSPAHFVLCEEDGTTEIVSETAEHYKQIVNVFSPGQVLKLYIYDDASVSVSFNNSSVTVNDNCACVYDGNSLRVN
ncbi:prepilin-type N-terminal cleavage/methylation domain-containing protein [Ruminococcus sp.]|uniref:PilW family protein n=1 Tax=Ruminococcus sp. TaxID=41978 RepID=UPI002590DB63|nr:prepilin-type N-terminal cleavage/methylation domain-containing protein [Ruminococcus sp.]MCR5019634.1 prepilin-type N-terminal cleavage/methylation domain-containing protein [Ruminococcus sp.]